MNESSSPKQTTTSLTSGTYSEFANRPRPQLKHHLELVESGLFFVAPITFQLICAQKGPNKELLPLNLQSAIIPGNWPPPVLFH